MPRGGRQSISESGTEEMVTEVNTTPCQTPSAPAGGIAAAGERPKSCKAPRRSVTKKADVAYGFFLPTSEDFDKWPGLQVWKESVQLQDSQCRWKLLLRQADYASAWSCVEQRTTKYLQETLLPFVDYRTELDDGKHVMLAFTGLHSVLCAVASAVCDDFRQHIKMPEFIAVVQPEAEQNYLDGIEEVDIAAMFRGEPLPEKRTEAPAKHSRLPAMDFETCVEPCSSPRTDFVAGSTESKRRRTMTPESEDATGARLMTGLSLSSTPERSAIQAAVMVEVAEKVSDFVDLRQLSSHELDRNPSVLSSQQNVFGALTNIVQQHYMQHFPLAMAVALRPVSQLMECMLDCQLNADNEPPKGKNAWSLFKGAFESSVRCMIELGLMESVVVPAFQLTCQQRVGREMVDMFDHEKKVKGFLTFHPPFSAISAVAQMIMGQTTCGQHLLFSYGMKSVTALVEWAKRQYIEQVVGNFFDLLLQWPKSKKTFIELKLLMDEASSHQVIYAVIVSLQRQFHSRLLRPGLNTQDILAVYTAAIRALRIVDPSRVIQDLVCQTVRVYLRSRPDTVRCIMSHITHINHSREGEENRKSSLPALDAMIEEEEQAMAESLLNPTNSASDIDMDNWEFWQPDPLYAELLTTSARTDRQADTIELLMSIYGGQDVFINEYQLILAEKLLGYYSFDAEEETKHLKMMTKRFGETLLQKSEVMSRDAIESKQYQRKMLSSKKLDADSKALPLPCGPAKRVMPVRTLVISQNYWPEIRAEKMKVPEALQQAMGEYTALFEEVTASRTIDVRPELGHVTFELHLDEGRSMHVRCNPVYVAIILHFTQQSIWPLDQLAQQLGLSAIVLKRKLQYWQRRNVLEECEANVYSVVADGSFLSQEDVRRMDDEEIESAVRYVAEVNPDEQSLQNQLQMFWKYMMNMLITVPTITIERLFSMVRMFIIRGQTKREVTIDHLRHFLDTKVRTRELIFLNNKYSLPKKDAKEA
ncbi:hypothetical protein RvY_13922 [Ramazzottius varieornatus]|uniref:Anaphase-promoting complex subunit 2 n=1 Tax=Ramazzottius varieornatus TaxID=947166 RepID=A0A1D1VTI3_RAMVA|nr:hypothetical protein RvY_13922 [Ramazzottius varieornatus]